MHRSDEIWRVTSSGEILICTVYEQEEHGVEVRAEFIDGTVVRTQQASDVERARVIAAVWLDVIRDLIE